MASHVYGIKTKPVEEPIGNAENLTGLAVPTSISRRGTTCDSNLGKLENWEYLGLMRSRVYSSDALFKQDHPHRCAARL